MKLILVIKSILKIMVVFEIFDNYQSWSKKTLIFKKAY